LCFSSVNNVVNTDASAEIAESAIENAKETAQVAKSAVEDANESAQVAKSAVEAAIIADKNIGKVDSFSSVFAEVIIIIAFITCAGNFSSC
jgi:hypothetical protein